MIEAPFGSGSPIWTAAPSPGFTLQTPMVYGNTPIGAAALGTSALSGGAGTIASGPRDLPAVGGLPAQGYVPGGVVMTGVPWLNLAPALPFAQGPPAAFLAPDPMTGVTAPALLGTVAMRRGQPQGPTNDQDVEDFIYDALEFLSGAGDVEVRCEGGRATLTGSVHHKRVKRDAGEIAWAIPGLQDVQNNLTITSRRRVRAAGRETEAPSNTQARK